MKKASKFLTALIAVVSIVCMPILLNGATIGDDIGGDAVVNVGTGGGGGSTSSKYSWLMTNMMKVSLVHVADGDFSEVASTFFANTSGGHYKYWARYNYSYNGLLGKNYSTGGSNAGSSNVHHMDRSCFYIEEWGANFSVPRLKKCWGTSGNYTAKFFEMLGYLTPNIGVNCGTNQASLDALPLEQRNKLKDYRIVVEPIYDFKNRNKGEDYREFWTIKGISKYALNSLGSKNIGIDLSVVINNIFASSPHAKTNPAINPNGLMPPSGSDRASIYTAVADSTSGYGYGIYYIVEDDNCYYNSTSGKSCKGSRTECKASDYPETDTTGKKCALCMYNKTSGEVCTKTKKEECTAAGFTEEDTTGAACKKTCLYNQKTGKTCSDYKIKCIKQMLGSSATMSTSLGTDIKEDTTTGAPACNGKCFYNAATGAICSGTSRSACPVSTYPDEDYTGKKCKPDAKCYYNFDGESCTGYRTTTGHNGTTLSPLCSPSKYPYEDTSAARCAVGSCYFNQNSSGKVTSICPGTSRAECPEATYPFSDEDGSSCCDPSKECCENDTRPQCKTCQLKDSTKLPSSCEEDNEGVVEEPKLCAILKGKEPQKNEYLWKTISEYVGAISDNISSRYASTSQRAQKNYTFCKIYCRESATYNFFDVVEAEQGRYFIYNITNSSSPKYTATVEGEKSCVSEIDMQAFNKAYDIANDNVRTTWNVYQWWKSLRSQPRTVADYSCNNGTYECGATRYCNNTYSYHWSGYFVGDNADGTSYGKNISYDQNGSSNYCSSRWENCCHRCLGRDPITKACTGGYSAWCCCNPSTSCGRSGDSNYVNSMINSTYQTYLAAVNKRDTLITDINKCNFINNTPSYSFGDTDNTKKIEYGYNGGTQKDKYSSLVGIGYNTINTSSDRSYCEDCEYDSRNVCTANDSCNKDLVSLGSTSIPTDKHNHWLGGTLNRNYKLSNSDYALYNTRQKVGYYQNKIQYTEVYTGDVKLNKATDPNWIQLDKYVYPLELNRENQKITVKFTYRLASANLNTGSKTYSCYVNSYNKTTIYTPTIPPGGPVDPGDDPDLGYIFRSIELSDVIPNNRTPGSNWRSALANSVTDAIEKKDVDYTAGSKDLQYTVILTAADIANVKRYNKSVNVNGNYMNLTLKCTSNRFCQSSFLDSFGNVTVMNNARALTSKDINGNTFVRKFGG